MRFAFSDANELAQQVYDASRGLDVTYAGLRTVVSEELPPLRVASPVVADVVRLYETGRDSVGSHLVNYCGSLAQRDFAILLERCGVMRNTVQGWSSGSACMNITDDTLMFLVGPGDEPLAVVHYLWSGAAANATRVYGSTVDGGGALVLVSFTAATIVRLRDAAILRRGISGFAASVFAGTGGTHVRYRAGGFSADTLVRGVGPALVIPTPEWVQHLWRNVTSVRMRTWLFNHVVHADLAKRLGY